MHKKRNLVGFGLGCSVQNFAVIELDRNMLVQNPHTLSSLLLIGNNCSSFKTLIFIMKKCNETLKCCVGWVSSELSYAGLRLKGWKILSFMEKRCCLSALQQW